MRPGSCGTCSRRGPLCQRTYLSSPCIFQPSDCFNSGRTRILDPQNYCRIEAEWTQAFKTYPQAGTGFLDLPRELRDRIYTEVLHAGKSIQLGSLYLDAKNLCHWHQPHSLEWSTSCALLRTCRQLHNEAAAILYGSNQFDIKCSGKLGLSDKILANNTDFRELHILPFNPAYRQFARNVSFFGSWSHSYTLYEPWPHSRNFFQNLGATMVQLYYAKGAYFHVYGDLQNGDRLGEYLRFVAGWNPVTPDPEVLAYARASMSPRVQLEYADTGDNIVGFLRTLAEAQGVAKPDLSLDVDFKVLKHMRYQVQVNARLGLERSISSTEELLHCGCLLGLTLAFSPASTEHAQQYQESENIQRLSAAQLVQESVHYTFMMTGCFCNQITDLGSGWYERVYWRTPKCSRRANEKRVKREIKRQTRKGVWPSIGSRAWTAIGRWILRFTERVNSSIEGK